MTEAIQRLVYYSRNRMGGSPEETVEAIHGILAASRRNNARAGITGALMFNAGCFGQVLEGPADAVEATFERIQQDPRHDEVSLLDLSLQAERFFGNWSMAFVGGSEDGRARYGSLAGDSGFDPSRMTGEALFGALRQLILEEETVDR
ncbi:Sensors of blue-light using FAD [Faunimonas pinastri]|uniref:Sensors of blue-light using FAD n=1 Tax=Faunimonas pinastri TaxID=1855383 RepID=A0A1H9PD78_9HYPH|nr:BLUF domain-containing protein [Faunimonas pinastri]SER46102.1 Sensors of blue-light using FAD [Faunimonas pinastri]